MELRMEYFDLKNRRYLGNKYKLIPFIKKVVEDNCEDCSSFFDVFSGTGVVADAFREFNLITNDLLYSNYVIHYAFFSDDEFDKEKLMKIIDKWNNISSIKEENYMSINFGGKYFSHETSKKIGYIREEIDILAKNGEINKREEYILISSLIYAMDRIASTCGHYDAYRKTKEYNDELVLKFPNIKENMGKNQIYNTDSNELVRVVKADIAYIDPPYNSRQYSDAYHLLENVARWEKPEVFGVAKKMNRKDIKSSYCTRRAPQVFKDLIENLDAKYILVSYSNMGSKGHDRSNARITDKEILSILRKRGEVKIFEIDYNAFTAGKSRIDNHKERLFLCKTFNTVASPLNYTGGKYKLLDQIKPLFPEKIDSMMDLFCGGCNVGINVDCKNVKFVDKEVSLIRLLNAFKEHEKDEILNEIDSIIDEFELSNSSKHGYSYYGTISSVGLGKYNKGKYMYLREIYNKRMEDSFYYDMIFYVLIVFSFNNQIRFNKNGEFNLPVGKRDFNAKMRKKLIEFIDRIHENNYEFIAKDFSNIRVEEIENLSFVYADPPYLITTASYNEQGGWNEEHEKNLLKFLDGLDSKGIRFALSNVMESKGRKNEILYNWTILNKDKYIVHYLNNDYSNSNYQTKNRDKNSTVEVLITNYIV